MIKLTSVDDITDPETYAQMERVREALEELLNQRAITLLAAHPEMTPDELWAAVRSGGGFAWDEDGNLIEVVVPSSTSES